MTDPSQAASVLLKLYELRTEPALRQARAWFAFEFHPASARDVLSTWLGPGHESAPYRMVTSYWDMAASLVTTGAIDADAFLAAHSEIFATFSKVEPFLGELRAAAGEPEFCKHIEAVISSAPDRDAILARRRAALLAAAKNQQAESSPPAA